jgi:ankyrin repeat protein
LLSKGESLDSLGDLFGLHAAAFHGHAALCQFLLDHGADVNEAQSDTGETALHAAVAKTDREKFDPVIAVLLARGANPDCATLRAVETGHFMRDCRTKGETPLHRAAAFGTEATIQMLLDAGATIDARDMYGDSPLSWASWYLRPRPILRKLCFGQFRA